MRHAAVAHGVGDFAQRQFVINQQLLYPLNFLADDEFLDGGSFNFGKQIAQLGVIYVQL